MSEARVCRVRRGPATAETLEAVHDDIDELWTQADFVPETDRMAFTLAVSEATTNVVTHAVPATSSPVELQVEITVDATRLEANIYGIGAAPFTTDPTAGRQADDDDESGRGLALIQALVSTVIIERRGDANVWVLRREHHGGQQQDPPHHPASTDPPRRDVSSE